MGILSRLESLLRSYLNDEAPPRWSGRGFSQGVDPDMAAAFDELEDFLKSGEKARPWQETGPAFGGGRYVVRMSQEVRAAYGELGLEAGASPEACKQAYKNLLKIHHPDRHAGHPGNFKKATEKTARINAAYDCIEKWAGAAAKGEGNS